MLIEIDDALLARHQLLLMKFIEEDEFGLSYRAMQFEKEDIVRAIINITTTAYFKRGDNEKENT